MKTQIIPVETHDDVISLRDKLSWVKARRVLLVYPRRGAALDTRLAWLLLKRKAEAVGASLGLVTHAKEAHRLAQEAGIPVFASVLEAQQAEWPTAPRRRAKRRLTPQGLKALRAELPPKEKERSFWPGARLLVFFLAVLALLMLLLFLLPAAEVRLSPVLLTQSLSFTARALPAGAPESPSDSLPLYLASVIIEGGKTWPASGQIPLAVAYARGNVRFRNLTNTVIGIPAGTIVRTVVSPPVRFITLQDAVVEAGVDRWVDAPVRAELPGAQGNLPPDSLTVVEGPLGANLAVTNPAPTYGGSERLVRAPSKIDRQQARAALLVELRRQALTLLQEQAGADGILIPETFAIVNVIEELALPAERQPGDVLVLRLKAEFSIRYLLAEDLRPRVNAALDAIVPAGFVPVEGTLSIEPIESVLEKNGALTCRFLVRRTIARRPDEAGVARLLRGRQVADASLLLMTHSPLNAPPQIQVKPSWWPWLPLTEFRIRVKW